MTPFGVGDAANVDNTKQLDTSAGRGAGDRPARLERRNRGPLSVLLGSLAALLRSTIPVPAFPSASHRPWTFAHSEGSVAVRCTVADRRLPPQPRTRRVVPDSRRWRHEERSPHTLRQYTAERRKQRPISLTQLRTSYLTLEHPELLPQQQDLDLLLPLRPNRSATSSSRRRSDQYRNDRTAPRERPATGADLTGQPRASTPPTPDR